MQQLREHLAQNPEAIQPLLQSLAAQNPGLAQAFAANPELLMQMLGGEFEGEDGDVPPGAQVINVTEEERAAIERVRYHFLLTPVVPDDFYIVGGTRIPPASCN